MNGAKDAKKEEELRSHRLEFKQEMERAKIRRQALRSHFLQQLELFALPMQRPRERPRLGDMYAKLENEEAKVVVSRYCFGEGVVVGWGVGRSGQLGAGGRVNLFTPFMIGGLDKAIRVSCTNKATVWLGIRSTVLTMGTGDSGELCVSLPKYYPQLSKVDGPMQESLGQLSIPQLDPADMVVDVTSGFAYFLCITHNGNIHAWGANNCFQCSAEETQPYCCEPQCRSILHETVVEVACANYTCLARTASGSVYGWGFVTLLGSKTDVTEELRKIGEDLVPDMNRRDRLASKHPVKLRCFEGEQIVRIRGGPWHFAAVDASGDVYTWGVGNNGRLGHGDEADVVVPKKVAALLGKGVVDVACGSFHTVFVVESGDAYVCGDNQAGQCGVPGAFSVPTPHLLRMLAGRKVIHASCGRLYTHLLLDTGEIVAYGSGLGVGVGMGYGLRMVHCRPVMENYTTFWMADGANHGFALTLPKQSFMFIMGPPHQGVQAQIRTSALREGMIHCCGGFGFTMMLSRRGSLYSFGMDGWAQLGFDPVEVKEFTEQHVPVVTAATRIPFFSRTVITYIATGFSFAVAICEGERVYSWGNNNYGQCGLGVNPRENKRITPPREIEWLADKQIIQVECGNYFTLALSSTGEVYTWGAIECCGIGLQPDPKVCPPHALMGGLALDSINSVITPLKNPFLSNIIQVAATSWTALALNAIGEIYMWGLSLTSTDKVEDSKKYGTPVKIQHTSFFTRIGCSARTGFAIDDSARLFLWGVNDNCQMGESVPFKSETPVHVFDNVRDVAATRYFVVILTFEGTFHMCGTVDNESEVCVSKSFHDTENLPKMMRQESLKAGRLFGLRVFSAVDHAIVLCEEGRAPPRCISAATRAMRMQPESIIRSALQQRREQERLQVQQAQQQQPQ